MTQTTCQRPGQQTGYRHEAFLWHGLADYVERTVPFISDAITDGTPVMVAVPGAHWAPVREALGRDAEQVRFIDMTDLGHNPARIIPAWLDFIAENGGGRRPVRGIGEPIWAGRREAEVVECQIHEAMLNLAVPPDTPMWLLCPYDADALDDRVLREAVRSHPSVLELAEARLSPTYDGVGHPLDHSVRPLSEAPAVTESVDFGRGDLPEVRRLVQRLAKDAGIVGYRAGDLVLGVNEVAANSLDHGGGAGTVKSWVEPGALVFEVQDRGQIADPLIGRSTPTRAQTRGRGLWMVNRLCDLVQMRSTPSGTVIRVLTWL